MGDARGRAVDDAVTRTIRRPRPDELARLQEIEVLAGTLFLDVGLPKVAADEPFSLDQLAEYLDAGRVWIAVEGDSIAGYALVDVVDGAAHLEQLSVDPECGRRGHGAALLTHVVEWAYEHDHRAVTLTTFEHVPWNAPYYARHGFEVVDEREFGPELRRLLAVEAANGLDPDKRVVMRRRVAPRQNAS